VSLLISAFILFTSGSAICCATTRTVVVGIVSDSSLKLATIKSKQLLEALKTRGKASQFISPRGPQHAG